MKQHLRIRAMTMAALFAALLAILSQIQIPLPSGVPVTMQTFGVALMGAVLGWKVGALSILVYLMMGFVGLPVFAGFGAGVAVLAGPTGGFLIGFVGMAILCGVGAEREGMPMRFLFGGCGAFELPSLRRPLFYPPCRGELPAVGRRDDAAISPQRCDIGGAGHRLWYENPQPADASLASVARGWRGGFVPAGRIKRDDLPKGKLNQIEKKE